MKDQYPNIKIIYIDEKVYMRIQRKYSSKISTWGFRHRNMKRKELRNTHEEISRL